MAISKVKLPDNSIQDIHDSRITGIDSSPTSGSGNVVTSSGVYGSVLENAGETIIGTQTAATGSWTGVSKLATATDLVSGYRFSYWLPYAGSGSATLTLTFQDGTTKTIDCYYSGASRLTTHFSAGNKLDFVYLENANVNGTMYTGCWVAKGYYENSFERMLSNYESRVIYSEATPLYRYKMCGYNDGKIVPLTITNQTSATIFQKTPVSVGIDPSMGIKVYWSSTAITSISSGFGNLYDEMPNYLTSYTFNDDVPAYRDVYLKGEIREDGLFYLDTTTLTSWYVFAPNRTSDGEYNSVFKEGCHYMYLGPTSSVTNRLQLKINNPVYIFTNGALRNVNGALPTVDTEDEFLYRKTPFVGDMMSVSGAKGRTIVWNQAFIATATTYTNQGGTFVMSSDGHITGEGTATGHSSATFMDRSLNFTVGHKILFSFSGSKSGFTLRPNAGTYGDDFMTQPKQILTASTESGLIGYTPAEGNTMTASCYIMVIDLTLMFGAGNEPTVEEFEAMFPLPYYEYNEGTLISNNAESVETVGRNLWDEEWEVGSISSNYGNNETSDSRIRSKNYIQCLPSTQYYLQAPSSYDGTFGFRFYDSDKNYLGPYDASNTALNGHRLFTTPSNCFYIRFMRTTTSYNHDICINLSDPAFNGQYDPYKRSELSVGLDSFDVKDSQGNVTTITGGLKSAGSVYDEIVGDKYIKRIGIVSGGQFILHNTSSANYNTYKYTLSDAAAKDKTTIGYVNSFGIVYDGSLDSDTIAKETIQYDYSTSKIFYISFAPSRNINDFVLYYELATPEEYTIVKPFPTGYAEIPHGGQQKVLPENTSSEMFTAPLRGAFTYSNAIEAPIFKVIGGTSSQFLKADGSVDSNTYAIESTVDSTLSSMDTRITALEGTDFDSVVYSNTEYPEL